MSDAKLPWDWPWGDDADMNYQGFMASFGNHPRSIQHLTVREIEEAKKYDLTPERYDELRELFESRQKDKVREKVKEQLSVELTNQLRPKIRAEIEEEARKKAQAAFDTEVRAKLLAEIRGERPHEKDVRAYRDLAREIELDSLAQAHAASTMADETSAWLGRRRTFTTPLCYALLLACPAVWYEAWTHTSGILFWITLAAYVAAAITFIAKTAEKNSTYENGAAAFRKTSSDYFMLAERAKKVRMVELPTATSQTDLRDVISNLANDKASADRHFHPSAKVLDKARVEVRDQLITEMDPERLIDEPTEEEASRLRG